MNDNAIVIIA